MLKLIFWEKCLQTESQLIGSASEKARNKSFWRCVFFFPRTRELILETIESSSYRAPGHVIEGTTPTLCVYAGGSHNKTLRATYTTVHIHFIATCYWLRSFCRGNRVSLLRFSIRQVYGRMNKWNLKPRSLPCCCALALNQWLMQETLCCAWLVRNWNLDLFCAWNSRLVLVASGPWHAVLLPLKWLLGKWQGHSC